MKIHPILALALLLTTAPLAHAESAFKIAASETRVAQFTQNRHKACSLINKLARDGSAHLSASGMEDFRTLCLGTSANIFERQTAITNLMQGVSDVLAYNDPSLGAVDDLAALNTALYEVSEALACVKAGAPEGPAIENLLERAFAEEQSE